MMGYYTRFQLNYTASVEDTEKIREYIKNNDALDVAFNYTDSTKWYDYVTDMGELSLTFPSILFEVSGEGDEKFDIWKAYFKNGKYQKCIGKVVFDEFDEQCMIPVAPTTLKIKI